MDLEAGIIRLEKWLPAIHGQLCDAGRTLSLSVLCLTSLIMEVE